MVKKFSGTLTMTPQLSDVVLRRLQRRWEMMCDGAKGKEEVVVNDGEGRDDKGRHEMPGAKQQGVLPPPPPPEAAAWRVITSRRKKMRNALSPFTNFISLFRHMDECMDGWTSPM